MELGGGDDTPDTLEKRVVKYYTHDVEWGEEVSIRGQLYVK